MERPLRIGLYSPFLGSTIGGGEKYFGVTAEALRARFPHAEIEILTPVPVDADRYKHMLGLNLDGIHLRSIHRARGGLRGWLSHVPMLRRLRNLIVSAQVAGQTSRYDLLISMVYALPAVSRARRGVILCQFPYQISTDAHAHRGRLATPHQVYAKASSKLRRRLFGAEIHDFQLVICQSEYVRQWVQRLWHRDAIVINPPIDIPAGEPDWSAKRRVILAVGRFFAGGHNKRHDLMVRAFRELCDTGLEGWELHLVGSVHRTTRKDVQYLESVQHLAVGYPVVLHLDARQADVQGLYRKASIYWHAAGYGVNAETRPGELEHFGMSTVEAMGHGAVPIVIARGGQVELITDGVNGYLWNEPGELKAKTCLVTGDSELSRRLGKATRRASHRYARERFMRDMVAALRPLVADLEADLNLTED